MTEQSAMRSLTLLDDTGDTKITWDEDTDDKILGIIEQKMAEGFVFYILKAVPIVNTTRLAKAKNIDEIRKAGTVTIRDEALQELFFAGDIGVSKSSTTDNITPIGKAKTAREVVTQQTVGVRPRRGG